MPASHVSLRTNLVAGCYFGSSIALAALCSPWWDLLFCVPPLFFWAVPTAFLTESAAAASIGLINSLGNLGGFVGP